MFMVLSSWQSHCESSPGSFDECRTVPSSRRPKTKPDNLGCESACTGCQSLHTHHRYLLLLLLSWYSFYCPTEGRRLSRPSWVVTWRDGLHTHRWSPILGVNLQAKKKKFEGKCSLFLIEVMTVLNSQCMECCACLQVTFYLYNWMSDLASQLEKQLMRQIQWHNARSHLVSCLSLQKMGLFRHLCFNELSADNNSQVLPNVYSFNPLIATLKPYSNGPSYSNTVIGTLADDGWAVTFRTVRRGLGRALAVPNVTANASTASVPTSYYSM